MAGLATEFRDGSSLEFTVYLYREDVIYKASCSDLGELTVGGTETVADCIAKRYASRIAHPPRFRR